MVLLSWLSAIVRVHMVCLTNTDPLRSPQHDLLDPPLEHAMVGGNIRVVHKKLTYKLSCYGVCEMVLTWIKNFCLSVCKVLKLVTVSLHIVQLPVVSRKEVFWGQCCLSSL